MFLDEPLELLFVFRGHLSLVEVNHLALLAVNYPCLLAAVGGFLEAGASYFDDGACRHVNGSRLGVHSGSSLHRRSSE